MKFIVFGSNGMAGHLISLYLTEEKHDVTGFALEQSKYIKSIVGDAQNVALIKDTLNSGKYDAAINCIGILNQFAEQKKDLAIYLNSYFPHLLAEITKNMKTQIIHMSTDCVFSGMKGQYIELDFRDGQTFYDRSKALGELNDNKNITLRNSIIGPDTNPNGIGLMNWFLQQNDEINGYTKAIWTGQTTLQLAKTMEAAAKAKANGLYNMVPKNSISKYELLGLMNRYMRNNKIKINKVDGVNSDKSLKRTNYNFNYEIPSYEEMMKDIADWINTHKSLYPHYFKGE